MAGEADEQTTAENNQIEQTQTRDEEPHSVFTVPQKRAIIVAASIASLFSPLAANIYFPALNTLANDLHVSTNLINLTVTTYLIFQGIAPTFIGSFSDFAGRRPAYIICFVIYIGANIGLALQNDYVALLVLRMVQASGSSGTVALATAIAADIVTSTERGAYVGYSSIGVMFGPSIAPVIGGLLDQYAGWKWIFWFLVIFSTAFFIPLLLFFPETCRAVVGNGSLPPPAWNMSLVSLFERYRARRKQRKEAGDAELGRTATNTSGQSRPKSKIHWPNPILVLRIMVDLVNFIILFSLALLFAAYYAVSASIPARFADTYGYNTIEISLIFIPIGVGTIIAAFTVGKLMDWNYRRYARRLGLSAEKSKQHNMLEFPIERARLEIAMPLLFVGAAIIIAYGWCIHEGVSVAGPIVLLLFLGYVLVAGYQSLSVLIVDLNRSTPATATAANNLFRCLFGAGASAIVNPLSDAVGYGWTCTIAAGVWLSFTPLLFLLMRYGQGWRKKKAERVKAKLNATRSSPGTDQVDENIAREQGTSEKDDERSERDEQDIETRLYKETPTGNEIATKKESMEDNASKLVSGVENGT